MYQRMYEELQSLDPRQRRRVEQRHVQELKVRIELGRDGLVQGQAALVDPQVAAHANSIVASLAFLAKPTFAPGGGLAQGAGILIQT